MSFVFSPTLLPEIILITPQIFGDERGFFMESYHKNAFLEAGITNEFIQDNHSKSKKWVLRGLHFQTQHTQAKLVRVTAWSVLDIVVDMRMSSPFFWKYIVIKLDAITKQMLFVPKGFAHGFLTLEDNTEFLYKCDDLYAPQFDSGLYYADLELWIDRVTIMNDYNITELIVSDKDKSLQTLDQYKKNPVFH